VMGVVRNVGAAYWPEQGPWLNLWCWVCFDYDTSRQFEAQCIRDDAEEPRLTIFRLEDGRVVLSTECMCTMPKDREPRG